MYLFLVSLSLATPCSSFSTPTFSTPHPAHPHPAFSKLEKCVDGHDERTVREVCGRGRAEEDGEEKNGVETGHKKNKRQQKTVGDGEKKE